MNWHTFLAAPMLVPAWLMLILVAASIAFGYQVAVLIHGGATKSVTDLPR
jgi:hypothetical protein